MVCKECSAMINAIRKMLRGREWNPKDYQTAIDILAAYVIELEAQNEN